MKYKKGGICFQCWLLVGNRKHDGVKIHTLCTPDRPPLKGFALSLSTKQAKPLFTEFQEVYCQKNIEIKLLVLIVLRIWTDSDCCYVCGEMIFVFTTYELFYWSNITLLVPGCQGLVCGSNTVLLELLEPNANHQRYFHCLLLFSTVSKVFAMQTFAPAVINFVSFTMRAHTLII